VLSRDQDLKRKKRLTKQQLSAGAGSKFSTAPFVQWVAASSAACSNSAGSSLCAFILISSTSAEKWSASPHGFASPKL